jgi:endonuclease/exonuclease/phosphatase (EEP) superfamily protein YafD
MPDTARPGAIWRWVFAALCASSILSLLGTRSVHLSLFGHFQAYAALAWMGSFALFATARPVRAAFRRPARAAATGALLCALHLLLIASLHLPAGEPVAAAEPARRLQVVWFNMQHNDNALRELEVLLQADPPDLLGLGETNGRSGPLLLKGFDHVQHSKPAGVGIWSRWPIEAGRAHLVPGDRDLVEVTIVVDGARCRVGAAHWRIPLHSSHAAAAEITASLAHAHTDYLLLGDLNTTPWSPQMRLLEEFGGLTQARRGRGVLGSWAPGRLRWLTLPIDHVLAKGAVRAENFELLPWTASDHRPVRADILLTLPR